MSFEYGLSNKNKTTLIYNGFEYTKKQSTKAFDFRILVPVFHF